MYSILPIIILYVIHVHVLVYIDNSRDNISKMKAEVEEIQELLKLEDDINLNKAKLLWIEIYDIDANIITLNRTIEKNEHAYTEVKNKLLLAESNLTEMTGIDEIKVKMDDINSEIESIMSEIENKRKAIQSKSRQVNAILYYMPYHKIK